jgi:hypothetical protein
VEQAEVTGYTKVHVEEAKSIEMDRTFKPWTKNGANIRVKLHDYVSLLPPEQWADVRAHRGQWNREQDVPGSHWQTRTGVPVSSSHYRGSRDDVEREFGEAATHNFVEARDSGG